MPGPDEKVEIRVPRLGVSEDEPITVSCWLVRPGDALIEGDRIVELLLGDMTFDVASPATGRLTRIAARSDSTVRVGSLLGVMAAD